MKCNFFPCKNEIPNENIFIISKKQTRYFCSETCKLKHFNRCKPGVPKSPESVLKRQKSLMGHFTSEETKKKISESRKFKISEEDKKIIFEMLKKPYYSYRLISEYLNIREWHINSYSNTLTDAEILKANKIRVKAYFNSNMLFRKETLDWLENNIEKYTKNEFKSLFKEVISVPYAPWFKKYFGKTFKREGWKFAGGITRPELKIQNILEENNIQYRYNEMVCVQDYNNKDYWYSVDFRIRENIFIEVQGDYWHANPEIYNYNNLQGVQRSNINRDKRKKAQIYTKYGQDIHYFEIWEHDIINETNKFKKQIKEILCIAQN